MIKTVPCGAGQESRHLVQAGRSKAGEDHFGADVVKL